MSGREYSAMPSHTMLLHAKDGMISRGMLFVIPLSLSTCQRVEWCLYNPQFAFQHYFANSKYMLVMFFSQEWNRKAVNLENK